MGMGSCVLEHDDPVSENSVDALPIPDAAQPLLLPVSAHDTPGLALRAAYWLYHAALYRSRALCYTFQTGRVALPVRAVFIGQTSQPYVRPCRRLSTHPTVTDNVIMTGNYFFHDPQRRQ